MAIPVRVGVVGSGAMGARHLRTWSRLGVARVLFSPTATHRTRLAADTGSAAVDSLDQLVDSCDVVDLCTPTDTHWELGMAAAAQHRAVICEKPLARTVRQARALLASCKDAGVQLFPAHVLRYFRSHAAARQRAYDGELGDVQSLSLHRAVDPPAPTSWLRDEERSGGVLLDLMIHDFDYARWVAGEVVSVRAERDDFAGVNRAEAWLTHAGGARSHVVGQWGGIVDDRFDIIGSAGTARSSDAKPDPDGTDEAELAFGAQLADFSNAIRTGKPARVTAADGLAALRIAVAAAESQRTGDSIDLATDAY